MVDWFHGDAAHPWTELLLCHFDEAESRVEDILAVLDAFRATLDTLSEWLLIEFDGIVDPTEDERAAVVLVSPRSRPDRRVRIGGLTLRSGAFDFDGRPVRTPLQLASRLVARVAELEDPLLRSEFEALNAEPNTLALSPTCAVTLTGSQRTALIAALRAGERDVQVSGVAFSGDAPPVGARFVTVMMAVRLEIAVVGPGELAFTYVNGQLFWKYDLKEAKDLLTMPARRPP